MHKHFSLIFLLTCLLFLVSACGQESQMDSSESTPSVIPGDETYDIALITDNAGIEDGSFFQAAWTGITDYATEHGVSYQHYDPNMETEDAYLEAISQAIANGAKLVICPGVQQSDAVYQAQNRYPDVYFVSVDYVPTSAETQESMANGNTYAILFAEEESGFLAGYSAVRDNDQLSRRDSDKSEITSRRKTEREGEAFHTMEYESLRLRYRKKRGGFCRAVGKIDERGGRDIRAGHGIGGRDRGKTAFSRRDRGESGDKAVPLRQGPQPFARARASERRSVRMHRSGRGLFSRLEKGFREGFHSRSVGSEVPLCVEFHAIRRGGAYFLDIQGARAARIQLETPRARSRGLG